MVSRLEGTLILLVLLGLGLAIGMDRQGAETRKTAASSEKKRLEIEEGVLREINATALLNEYRSARAYQIGQRWYFETFLLQNPQILWLRSRKARKIGDRFTLEGEVRMLRPDGSHYAAREVRYDSRAKTLESLGPFRAWQGENRVRGIDFFYDLRTKVSKAEQVFAHYVTAADNASVNGVHDIIDKNEVNR